MELRNRNFILIDTETTGFDEKKHQILEVGILVIKDLKVIDQFEVKIKHREYTITAKAMEVNNINYRNLDIMQLAMIKNMEGKISLEKQDLDSILKELNIEVPKKRHRALIDCYLEFKAMCKLLNM